MVTRTDSKTLVKHDKRAKPHACSTHASEARKSEGLSECPSVRVSGEKPTTTLLLSNQAFLTSVSEYATVRLTCEKSTATLPLSNQAFLTSVKHASGV